MLIYRGRRICDTIPSAASSAGDGLCNTELANYNCLQHSVQPTEPSQYIRTPNIRRIIDRFFWLGMIMVRSTAIYARPVIPSGDKLLLLERTILGFALHGNSNGSMPVILYIYKLFASGRSLMPGFHIIRGIIEVWVA